MRRLVAACLMASALAVSHAEDAKPEAGSPKVAMAVFNDARIEQVLLVVGQQAGVAVVPLGKVPGSRLTLSERDVDLETLLGLIAAPRGWVWFRMETGDYGLADKAWYDANELPKKAVEKTYVLEHLAPSYVEGIARYILTPGASSVTADDRTMKMIVVDVPEGHERLQDLLKELDVAEPTEELARRLVELEQGAARRESPRAASPSGRSPFVALSDAPALVTGPRMTRIWTDAPVAEFLAHVGEPFGLRMEAKGKAEPALVTYEANDAPVGMVLAEVLHANGWILGVDDATGEAVVCDPEWYQVNVDAKQIASAEYSPANRSAQNISAALFMHAFVDAAIRVDEAANSLVFSGISDTVEELVVLAKELDKNYPGVSPATLQFLDQSTLARALAARQGARDVESAKATYDREWENLSKEAESAEGGDPATSPMTREKRLRQHEERIRGIIEERRLKRLQLNQAQKAPPLS